MSPVWLSLLLRGRHLGGWFGLNLVLRLGRLCRGRGGRSRRDRAATAAHPGRNAVLVLIGVMGTVQRLDEEVLAGQVGNVMLERADSGFGRARRHGLRHAGLGAPDGV